MGHQIAPGPTKCEGRYLQRGTAGANNGTSQIAPADLDMEKRFQTDKGGSSIIGTKVSSYRR
jgi:hypothetical protein